MHRSGPALFGCFFRITRVTSDGFGGKPLGISKAPTHFKLVSVLAHGTAALAGGRARTPSLPFEAAPHAHALPPTPNGAARDKRATTKEPLSRL